MSLSLNPKGITEIETDRQIIDRKLSQIPKTLVVTGKKLPLAVSTCNKMSPKFLADSVEQGPLLAYVPVIIQDTHRTYISKTDVMVLIAHGYNHGEGHGTYGIRSEDLYQQLSSVLIKNELNPIQIFISCDPEDNRRLKMRWDQTEGIEVIGFNNLINEIEWDIEQGVLRIHLDDMRQMAGQAHSPIDSLTSSARALLHELFTAVDHGRRRLELLE